MVLEGQELISFLKKQIDLENMIVEEGKKSVKGVENVLVRELIRGIALDSMKHANMLEAMVALISGAKVFLTEKESERIGGQIKRHIELEKQAIETYSTLLEHIKDERMRLLVDYILKDERRHHELLRKIDKIIVEAETLREEDLWEMVWKYSVFHGAPGG
ncbi:MAG: ferritin-like domain-containing protein [Thermoproteota archaeon]|nr:MAG: ferritin-like domain-containing protein [Candidatus Korarchaeota archaeon]RLG48657.1 MAG: ferritin-like domain-containing protein [Candidatus Korarchaeota archaeon]